MPTYEYLCEEHGYFEKVQRIADHAEGTCPTCESACPQVLTRPPGLDIESMSRAGMPGAWETVGNRITKRHRSVPQAHKPTSRT